jgi:hypothetical protein
VSRKTQGKKLTRVEKPHGWVLDCQPGFFDLLSTGLFGLFDRPTARRQFGRLGIDNLPGAVEV